MCHHHNHHQDDDDDTLAVVSYFYQCLKKIKSVNCQVVVVISTLATTALALAAVTFCLLYLNVYI
jgi:hypothetical protein